MNMLRQKASKALFKLRHTLYQLNLPPSTSCYLFDTLVRLINTYGCETWGAFLSTKDKISSINHEKYSLFDEPCFEKLHIKHLKTVFSIENPKCLFVQSPNGLRKQIMLAFPHKKFH